MGSRGTVSFLLGKVDEEEVAVELSGQLWGGYGIASALRVVNLLMDFEGT